MVKRLRRLRTAIVCFILILICFAIIVQGSIYKVEFSHKIPNLNFCKYEIPYVYSFAVNVSDYSTVALARPPVPQQHSHDASCSAMKSNTFYAVMTYDGNYTNPLSDYNITSCKTKGLCPRALGEDQFCPCVSITSSEQCKTAECSLDPKNPDSRYCKNYAASVIGSCYCYSNLLAKISSTGVTGTIDYINNAKDDVCYPFLINYASASALTYLATFVTVLINAILEYFLDVLTTMESHTSVDKREASLMIKVCIATLFNMALIVLIAYGLIQNLPQVLVETKFFKEVIQISLRIGMEAWDNIWC